MLCPTGAQLAVIKELFLQNSIEFRVVLHIASLPPVTVLCRQI